MRPHLIVFAALLLSGCWEGTNLYADGDAKQALPAGHYKLIARDGETHTAQVSAPSSGMTRFTVDGEDSFVGFVPLDPTGRMFVSWSTEKDAQFYEVAVRQPDMTMILFMPSCEGAEAEIARNADASVEAGTIPTCHFSSRASLEAAMRRTRPTAAQEVLRLIPMRN